MEKKSFGDVLHSALEKHAHSLIWLSLTTRTPIEKLKKIRAGTETPSGFFRKQITSLFPSDGWPET